MKSDTLALFGTLAALVLLSSPSFAQEPLRRIVEFNGEALTLDQKTFDPQKNLRLVPGPEVSKQCTELTAIATRAALQAHPFPKEGNKFIALELTAANLAGAVNIAISARCGDIRPQVVIIPGKAPTPQTQPNPAQSDPAQSDSQGGASSPPNRPKYPCEDHTALSRNALLSRAHRAQAKPGPFNVCPLSKYAPEDDATGTGAKPIGSITDGITQVADDLARIIAEIVADRAKRKGFELIRKRVEDFVCSAEYRIDPGTARPLLKRTCNLVKNARVEALASNAKSLRAALYGDLLELVTLAAVDSASASLPAEAKDVLRGILQLVRINFDGGKLRTTLPDPKIVLDMLASTNWSSHLKPEAADVWNKALAAARVCVRSTTRCEVTQLIANEDMAKVAPLAQLLVNAARAQTAAGRIDRWRISMEVVSWVLANLNVDKIKSLDIQELRNFLIAAINRDLATMLSSGAAFAGKALQCKDPEEEDKAKQQGWCQEESGRRALRVLSTLAAFAATYGTQGERVGQQRYALQSGSGAESGEEGAGEATDADRLYNARKKLIEDLVEEMTDRTGRKDDTIVSLGGSAKLVTGLQWVREADGNLGKGEVMAPQFSLPMGVALDVGCGQYCAFHAMAYVLDLGQFTAYSGDEGINRPRWDTMLLAGGEIGFAFGHETPFTITGDVRYAPTLFSQSDAATTEGERGGALRVGLSVGYYVPLFDFN